MKDINIKENVAKYKDLIAEAEAQYFEYLRKVSEASRNAIDEETAEKMQYSYLKKDEFIAYYLFQNGLTFEKTAYWDCGAGGDDDYWACTNCGFKAMAADDLCDPYEAEMHYCEKCGARMIKKKGQ